MKVGVICSRTPRFYIVYEYWNRNYRI